MVRQKLRVAAYCRVSTDKEDQANSLAGQRRYFTQYITDHEDWILQDVYYDEGISGTQTKNRAGFNAMIAEAKNGGIDLILTKEVCRFARNTVDALSYTRMLKDRGVGVIFTIDHIDTRDSDGELRLTLMASIAQEESRKTSERVKWGQKRRMEQGVVFGRDLLGYTVKEGKLTVNEAEAPIVCAIFHKYTNEGKGAYVIARELTQEGYCPKRGAHWSNTVILRALHNEKYVGDLCQKKTFTPNFLTHEKKYNRGNEEMIYLQNHHEPIIDRDLWERTKEELKRRAPSEEKRQRHSCRYWCSGKLYCGLCGKRYVSRTKTLKNGAVYKAWRCYAASGKLMGCGNGSVNECALLACMRYCICRLPLDREELKSELLEEIGALHGSDDKKRKLLRIRARIDAVNEKKRKAADLMLAGIMNGEDWREQTRWYDKQLAGLTRAFASEKNQDEKLPLTSDRHECERCAAAIDEILRFAGVYERLYREILDKMVVYHGDTVEVWLKELPFGIGLKIASHGRGGAYTTDILSESILFRSKDDGLCIE